MESYKDACYKDVFKQAVSVFLYTVKNMLKTHCKNVDSKRSKALLAAAPCLNDGTPELIKCSDKTQDRLIAVEKLGPSFSKLKLGTLCCGYVEFTRCVESGLLKVKQNCKPQHVTTIMDFARLLTDSTTGLMCGDLTGDTDRCDHFQYRKNNSTVKYHSVMAPIVHIVTSL